MTIWEHLVVNNTVEATTERDVRETFKENIQRERQELATDICTRIDQKYIYLYCLNKKETSYASKTTSIRKQNLIKCGQIFLRIMGKI
jgi:hypothetical protein